MSETTTQKRTITPEQRAKMIEGRKRAMEERRKMKEQIKSEEKEAKIKEKKLEKEKVKHRIKQDKEAKEEQKKKELEAELQALQQQKDRIETMKKTMEHRNKFRAKIRAKEQQEQGEVSLSHTPTEELFDPLEELDMLEDQIEEESKATQDLIHEEEKMFRHTASALAHNSKPATRKIFEKLTGSYDRNKNITENLNEMSNTLKIMIADTLKQVKKNEKAIEKAQQEQGEPKEVEQVPYEEVKQEIKYKSNLSSLMKLR